jgi:hypothetical protein
MTAFSLQVTSSHGRCPADTDDYMNECIAYWDQDLAGAELQVAMDKMNWMVEGSTPKSTPQKSRAC